MGVLKVYDGTTWRDVGCPVSTTVADTFDRADNATSLGTASDGGSWTVSSYQPALHPSPTFGIVSNQAYASSDGGPTVMARRELPTASVDMTVDFVAPFTNQNGYLFFGVTPDPYSGYRVSYQDDFMTLHRHASSSSSTQLASAALGSSLSGTHRITYTQSTGAIVVQRGGVNVISTTDASPLAGTWVGFGMDAGSGHRFPSFTASAVGYSHTPGLLKLWDGTQWVREACDADDLTLAHPLKLWDGTTWQAVACMVPV